jgi:hypothetical protein
MSNKREVYQVWHENDWPIRRALYQMGKGPKPQFPQDHTHVANVTADSLDEVWEIIRDKGDRDNWQCWERHPSVHVLAPIKRSTSRADIVFEPDGEPHYAEDNGFDYSYGSDGSDFHMMSVLCQMSMARDNYKPTFWQRVQDKAGRAVKVLRDFYTTD